MTGRRWAAGLAGLAVTVLGSGCPRPIPDHLRLDAPTSSTPAAPITDLPSALRAIVGRDPLGRSPVLPDVAALEGIDGGAPIAAFVRQVQAVEGGDGPVERLLQQVEDDWRTTAAVPLARGYRLRLAETALSNLAADPDGAERSVVSLITPLGAASSDPTLPLRPLAWLGGAERPDVIRAYAERWVLTSWLASPELPVEVLSDPISGPQYDGLRATSIGSLVVARATRAAAPDGVAPALADLRRATVLALTRAAADRDVEQARWAEQKRQLVDELGDPDPIAFLLRRAASGLVPDAGSDQSAGGALLSFAALRWIGQCASAPCAGVDRVEAMQFASRWHPQVAELAAAWQVVALKEAVDGLEVGRDTTRFPVVMIDLADTLLGTGAGPLDAQLLRKQRPDEVVWLALCRAVGTEGVTDWDGTRAALGGHLAREAERAGGLTTDPSLGEPLGRVRSRAIP